MTAKRTRPASRPGFRRCSNPACSSRGGEIPIGDFYRHGRSIASRCKACELAEKKEEYRIKRSAGFDPNAVTQRSRRRWWKEVARENQEARELRRRSAQYCIGVLKAHGWTDERIGATVGVHVATIRRWRNGTAPQTGKLRALRSLARDMGMPTTPPDPAQIERRREEAARMREIRRAKSAERVAS